MRRSGSRRAPGFTGFPCPTARDSVRASQVSPPSYTGSGGAALLAAVGHPLRPKSCPHRPPMLNSEQFSVSQTNPRFSFPSFPFLPESNFQTIFPLSLFLAPLFSPKQKSDARRYGAPQEASESHKIAPGFKPHEE